MSPIPSLPTDNLYKFCAVAGSVAIVVSVLVAFQAWRDLLGQQFSMRTLVEEQADREFDYKIADAVSKPWWRTDDERAHPDVEATKTAELEEQARRLKTVVAESGKRLEAERDRLNRARYDLGIIALGAGIFMLLGVALVIYGFRKWHVLQLKQDQLLELELKQRLQETAKRPNQAMQRTAPRSDA